MAGLCVGDLEDELIRSLGVWESQRVIEGEGDLPAFRIFQNQPFQRDRSPEQQLHRFFGTTSGRKAQYARALADGLDLSRVPRPLEALLDQVRQAA
jgi:hypothetical protein